MFSACIWDLFNGVIQLFAQNSQGEASPFALEELPKFEIGVYSRGLALIDKDIG